MTPALFRRPVLQPLILWATLGFCAVAARIRARIGKPCSAHPPPAKSLPPAKNPELALLAHPHATLIPETRKHVRQWYQEFTQHEGGYHSHTSFWACWVPGCTWVQADDWYYLKASDDQILDDVIYFRGEGFELWLPPARAHLRATGPQVATSYRSAARPEADTSTVVRHPYTLPKLTPEELDAVIPDYLRRGK